MSDTVPIPRRVYDGTVKKIRDLETKLAAAEKVLYDISTGHEGDWSCNCPAMGMARDVLRDYDAAEGGDDEPNVQRAARSR